MRVTPPPRTGRKRRPLIAAALLLVLPLLGSCSQLQSMTNRSPLPVDPADPCGSQRADFAASKNYFTDEIISGALTGAVVGTIGGAGVAWMTGGNVGTGALIGAGTGAVVGGVGAYTKTLAQKSRDQAEMAQHVNDDLRREGDEIDHTAATFARLRQCRFGQAALVKAQVHSNTLTRQVGQTQLAWERDRFDEEIKLAHEYDLTMAKRGSQFQEAADTVRHGPSPPPNARLASAAASVSVPEKRHSFDRTVANAETNKALAFDIDSNAKLTLRDHASRPV